MPNTTPPAAQAAVQNRLLRALPPPELERLWPRLEAIELPLRTIVLPANAPIEHVHFIERGTCSMITTLLDGAQIEVGLVGFEGFVGLPVLLGAPSSTLEGMVQLPGRALRLCAPALREALRDLPTLMTVMLRYVDSFHAVVAQAAACNGRHRIEERLARWILMTQDKVGNDCFPMTQEFIATMLGVRRPGVTLAVGALDRAGLIQHVRGTMRVLDRLGLEAASCECYYLMRDRFAWQQETSE